MWNGFSPDNQSATLPKVNLLNAATSQIGRWTLFHVDSIGSTNTVCRDLPPWSALRADSQTQGRGRLGRAFSSASGGLWLSAVLPLEGPAPRWEGFSLQVGASLLQCLRSMGLDGVRLRWPNDLMVGSKKIAGLLIEQPASGKIIVGFGLNVHNAPWEEMPDLSGSTTRLCDWITPPPIEQITCSVLDAIANAHELMAEHGMKAAIEELNRDWSEPKAVELLLSGGGLISGAFVGLDTCGNLRLLDHSGQAFLVEHPQVERLRELF